MPDERRWWLSRSLQKILPENLIEALRFRWEGEMARQAVIGMFDDLKKGGESWPEVIKKFELHDAPISTSYIADLRGMKFDGMDLSGFDLCFVDLRYSSFQDCTLVGTIFQSSDISFCNFSRSNMLGADLFEVRANDSNFTRCRLEKAIMMNSDFSGSSFEKSLMTMAELDLSNLDAL